MKKIAFYTVALTLSALTLPAIAAGSSGEKTATASSHAPIHSTDKITQGVVTVEGIRISYKAKTGILVLKNADGKPIASMSYVAYFKQGVRDESKRPITFLYNGGPGSSTIWLHMLAFGPKRVIVGNGTLTPPAPYKLVNNDYSLLDATDLVFIDAPGTGFGRVIDKGKGGAGKPSDVYGIDADAHAFANFITQFLTQNGRWTSPKYLFGESYGTTRSAVLANILETRKDVGLNGVMLLSAILNFNIGVDFPQIDPGVNIGYELGLPSYAATAYYHHKLPQQPDNLDTFLHQVEAFAMNQYAAALDQGDQLSDSTKQAIAEKLHEYTGLPTAYILKGDLRITGGEFAHELLGENDNVTGRLDSRYSGPAMDPLGQNAQYDPLDSAIDRPTVAEFNHYVRDTLDFGKKLTYKPQINVFMEWNWKHEQPGIGFALPFTPNVMPDLAAAMKHDPNLKVMLNGGYFDLGTPFYSAEYEMHQLTIPSDLQKNISYHFYRSGHMVYLNPTALKELHDNVVHFINSTHTSH